MHWRQVVVLRAYAKYLRQMGNTNSFGFIADTLLANPDVTRGLVALFEARFDPALGDAEPRGRRGRGPRPHWTRPSSRSRRWTPTGCCARFAEPDRGHAAHQLLPATRRYLSFKLDPAQIDGLPFPRPMFEIWVYSPRVEGVHLRFGKVARGGLRWSDRREDFRTEVLGLVKAQTVKNAVIVPTGAKGGFFAKQLPEPRR